MLTARQPFGAPGDVHGDEDVAMATLVEELSRRFAAFRRDNPRHARVPRGLRAAVMAAISKGVTPTRLRRACGVSTSQLDRWRAASVEGHEPRVFSVVGGPSPRTSDVIGWQQYDALELRLGPWSVRVQLAEERESRQG